MDIIEIKDDSIDTEEIIREIKTRIRKRKEDGTYEKLIDLLIKNVASNILEQDDDVLANYGRIKRNTSVSWDYPIKSHRKFIGRYIDLFKKQVRKILRIFLKPIFRTQEVYNMANVQIIEYLLRKTKEMEERLNSIEKK